MDEMDGREYSELMRKSTLTAQYYMGEACKFIDMQFGKGYALANPDLVGAFMQTSAQDFQATVWVKHLPSIVAAVYAANVPENSLE